MVVVEEVVVDAPGEEREEEEEEEKKKKPKARKEKRSPPLEGEREDHCGKWEGRPAFSRADWLLRGGRDVRADCEGSIISTRQYVCSGGSRREQTRHCCPMSTLVGCADASR